MPEFDGESVGTVQGSTGNARRHSMSLDQLDLAVEREAVEVAFGGYVSTRPEPRIHRASTATSGIAILESRRRRKATETAGRT
jgi:hypothetical protein